MPLIATRGASSVQGFGQFAQQTAANYIEDVFSTYLYTGTGASQTITNNIDLSTKSGMVWIKDRTSAYGAQIYDTVRGAGLRIGTYGTFAQQSYSALGLNAFSSSGFSLGSDTSIGVNRSGDNTVSWTFREQPKFFDIVTYTGTGSNTTIAHNLGSVPGSIIIKRTDTAADWAVYHRSLANTQYLVLNTTAAPATGATWWNSTTPTSAVFSVGTDATVNASGGTYVAYVFAHDAGGFGLTGSDNVISCGSGTGGTAVTLGYEPQWVIIKKTAGVSAWYMVDNMRGWTAPAGVDQLLAADSSAAEFSSTNYANPTATGFIVNAHTDAFIYIAIRRGPMKVPTLGTSVFYPYAASAPGNAVVTTGFPVDLQIQKNAGAGTDPRLVDRLRGVSSTPTSPSAAFPFLVPSGSTAETTGTGTTLDWGNTGFTVGNTYTGGAPAWAVNFRRAPSFFDEVCYTGTGANATITHNLGVVPEMIIVKGRSLAGTYWNIFQANMGVSSVIYLNFSDPVTNSDPRWQNTSPTATSFFINNYAQVNSSGGTYVAYLFATCAGVSKVFSYTGNGSSQTINCGFTGGARFVMIKRTDSTGDWYVWDTARGIVAGNDAHLSLNSTAAEVTTDDTIDTDSTGFVVNQLSATDVNVSSATYIGLAIA